MERIEVFLILSMALCHVAAWTCGNRGQCTCTSSGVVLCEDSASAPFFTKEHRKDKSMTIVTSDGEFDIESIKDTSGFTSVLVLGLSSDHCGMMTSLFPWSRCTTAEDAAIVSGVTVTTLTISAVVKTKGNAESIHGPTTGSRHGYGTGMIVWTVLSTIIGGILTCCILVSLVNLHARINSHARANDPALCAIDCCLKCMALILLPLHLIAKCCNCTWGNMHTMESGTPPTTTPFTV